MVTLTATELAAMRAAVNDLMPDTCYILSETARTGDGQGWFTSTWGTAGTSTCRLDSIRGQEKVSGGAVQPFHGYVLTLPNGTSITEQNRVQLGASTFSVTAVDNSKSWSACVRVMVEKL